MDQFEKWGKLKSEIDQRKQKFYIKYREVWLIHMGKNVGVEEDGKGDAYVRPVLVMKKVGNIYIGLPMTTGGKDTIFYYRLDDRYFDGLSRIILSQIRGFDSARFIKKIGHISNIDYIDIKKKLKALVL